MIRLAAATICLMAPPGMAAASGIALSTCEDRGAGTRAMLIERREDRFAYFVEQDLAAPAAFDVETSRHVIADCRTGWRIGVASADPRATGLMHEVYFGETAHDRMSILALFRREGVAAVDGRLVRGHCACKVDPAGETHLVDD